MRSLCVLAGTVMLLLAAVPAFAQYGDGHIRTGDSMKIDRRLDGHANDRHDGVDSTQSDTLVTGHDADSAFFQQIDSSEEQIEPPEPHTFFKKRGGIFFGSIAVDLLNIDLKTLDPTLDGTPVTYGVEIYTLLNSWLIGGAGVSTTLYGMSSNYDRFTFGYGGALLGYDVKIFYGAASLQGSMLVGAGGLEMIKKRPDLDSATGGRDILERFRKEDFFCVRPGISLGFSPVNYVRISAGVTWLLPFGSSNVADLKTLSYGLRLTLGLGD